MKRSVSNGIDAVDTPNNLTVTFDIDIITQTLPFSCS